MISAKKKASEPCDPEAESTKGEVEETTGASRQNRYAAKPV